MRSIARWFLLSVLVLDAIVVVALLGGGTTRVGATGVDPAGPGPLESVEGPVLSREALERLGEQLAARAAELERRETELEELLRGGEVLRRAGLIDEKPAAEAETAQPARSPAEVARTSAAFQALQRAYANMEPESAAAAMAELAGRDKQVVVELLLALNARVSGAILDALTQTNAKLSADLAYEIWKLGATSAG